MRLSEVTKMGYPENDWRNYLEHSAKGDTWENHKYLYIDANGRYIYPEDVRQMGVKGTAKNLAGAAPGIARRTGQRIRSSAARASTRTRNTFRSGENVNRRIYRMTGVNVKSVGRRTASAISRLKNRALDSLRTTSAYKKADVARQKARNKVTDAKIAIGNTKARARTLKRNAMTALNKAKNTARSKQILATTRAKMNGRKTLNRALDTLRNTSAYKKADVKRQQARNKVTDAKIAVGNAKAKVRTLKRNATTALKNTNTYKRASEKVSNARTQVGNFVSDIKERLKKKKK